MSVGRWRENKVTIKPLQLSPFRNVGNDKDRETVCDTEKLEKNQAERIEEFDEGLGCFWFGGLQ